MNGPRILLVVGGGIAAYKACELVRLIRKEGGEVTCVLTESGSRFVTPMALAALSENPVHTTLWDLKNEVEMGHIQLSRQADLVVVCPATADLLAKMSHGIADDLATTLLLATDKPVMAVPAMNVRMWQHNATMRNVETLRSAGVDVMEPEAGSMACGEFGPGRLPEPIAIWQRIAWELGLGPVEVAPLPGSAPAPGAATLAGPAEASLSVPDPGFALLRESVPDTASVQFSLPGSEGGGEAEELDLGGLSGAMITRGRRQPVAPLEETSVDEDAYGAGFEPPDWSGAEEPTPPLNLDGPLLSKKGRARSAPPTDPAALHHLISGGASSFPEPVEGGGVDDGQHEFVPDPGHQPLTGKHVLITAGPTHEKIDPVRYIANRSSGKQGYAIAAAAAAAGAQVTLVSGPVSLPTPPGVDRIDVESAQDMAEAVKRSLPADVAIMVAAVADWRLANAAREKIKKRGSAPPALLLTENPDILAMVGAMPNRPGLLIGFAAETQDVIENAKEKRKRKGADWIVANDVSGDVMGGSANTVHIVTGKDIESLPEMPKEEVARAIVERIVDELER